MNTNFLSNSIKRKIQFNYELDINKIENNCIIIDAKVFPSVDDFFKILKLEINFRKKAHYNLLKDVPWAIIILDESMFWEFNNNHFNYYYHKLANSKKRFMKNKILVV